MATGQPDVFVYTVKYDDGFAPNPFHGVCSLSTCKPDIRKAAQLGDIIIGKAAAPNGHRLVFAMEVDEILTYDRILARPSLPVQKTEDKWEFDDGLRRQHIPSANARWYMDSGPLLPQQTGWNRRTGTHQARHW